MAATGSGDRVRNERIVVLGTGYVGLPLALMLAKAGFEVVGVDINANIVRAMNEGILHIKEEKLEGLMAEPSVRRNLKAQETPAEGDVFIIAVPTPLDPRKKVADLSYVTAAVASILPVLRRGNLLIVESTVPPLTCREVIVPLLTRAGFVAGEDILLAHCPERILPGDVFYEIVHNDRVIGGINEASTRAARAVYERFVDGAIYETDDVTAELVKLMENAYRDVNIALANEFALVAQGLGVNVRRAIEISNKHPRVAILSPGIGVGGHCIPIDPWFIKQVDPAHSKLIFAARTINDEMPTKIAGEIRRAVSDITHPRIVAVGMTYKANTHDMRESPALQVIDLLCKDGYDVARYDPLVEDRRYASLAEAAAGADCLAVLVEHGQVMAELEAQGEEICRMMRTPRILRFWQ